MEKYLLTSIGGCGGNNFSFVLVYKPKKKMGYLSFSNRTRREIEEIISNTVLYVEGEELLYVYTQSGKVKLDFAMDLVAFNKLLETFIKLDIVVEQIPYIGRMVS
jgi:hypothetical protein